MKQFQHQSDEFDKFVADLESGKSGDAEFRKNLKLKLHKNYYGPQWLFTITRLFSSRFVLGGVGSFAVLLIFISVLNKYHIFSPPINVGPSVTQPSNGKDDGWLYMPNANQEDAFGAVSNFSFAPMAARQSVSMKSAGNENIGLATGGAKDINNFRENIKNGYLPLTSDITYEGLYYDYYFDTGNSEECRELFCPSYAQASSRDPYSGQTEYYMTVGLNSGIKQNEFARKKLNLVVVLDISGSMGSRFNSYYYDGRLSPTATKNADEAKSKMAIADESVVALLDQLRSDDRFGVVLFDDRAYEAKKLGNVSEMNMSEIKKHILKIKERGGTNHEAGFKMGVDFIKDSGFSAQEGYDNRIIFITDAMPNTGATDVGTLLGLMNTAAEDKIYTTFIGVGIDFNTELIENISKVRGANYYSITTAAEFRKRLGEEFEFMVTPLVYDLSLDLQSDGWEIEHVFGSPDSNPETGRLMYVRTLFPSSSEEGQTKGGIVLLKLKKTNSAAGKLKLTASYTDLTGRKNSSVKIVDLGEEQHGEYYQNSGIRKAVLLTRYAALMRLMISIKREVAPNRTFMQTIDREGLVVDDRQTDSLWERGSVKLDLTAEDKKAIAQFRDYIATQSKEIGDNGLMREVDILDLLSR